MTNLVTLPRTLLAAFFGVLALVPYGAAHAITYNGYANAKNWDPFTPLAQIFSEATPDPASYTAQAGGNTAQSITGEANGGSVYAMANSAVVHYPPDLDISGAAGATTSLTYQVKLIGPETPVVVPVRVIANGYVKSMETGSGLLSFVVNYDAGGNSAQLLDSKAVYNTGSDVFSFDRIANFKVNAYFDVYLSVTASAGYVGAANGGWSQAFLDPVFTIDDPVQASLYHFEGVPGITSSVPEPASWALMMLGLGVVCRLLTGRKKKS